MSGTLAKRDQPPAPRVDPSHPRARLASACVYAVTPALEPTALVSYARRIIAAGVDMLQLRSPELSSRQLFDVALEMATLSREADVLFIVNDRVDIAIAADAHGVHLGQIDLSVEAARRIAPPDFLVGASAATVPRARRAMVAGADYLGSGAAFPSAVKPDRRVIGPEGVAVVQAAVDIPVFAIGGVGPDNADRLRRAGVTRMCVITALAEATDPAAVIARLRGEA